jgi:hypothetical protein
MYQRRAPHTVYVNLKADANPHGSCSLIFTPPPPPSKCLYSKELALLTNSLVSQNRPSFQKESRLFTISPPLLWRESGKFSTSGTR